MATRHSYKLARLRRLSPLTWRPRAVTWSRQPLTDTAPPPVQRGPSVRTRPPQGIYDAATNPSLSLSLSPSISSLPLRLSPSSSQAAPSLSSRFPTARSLSFPLCLCLFLHSPLRRRLKYLHGSQMKRYCAESLDYLWSNAGKIGRWGGREYAAVIAGCNSQARTARTAHSAREFLRWKITACPSGTSAKGFRRLRPVQAF